MVLTPTLESGLWTAIGRTAHDEPLSWLTLKWLDDAAIETFSAGEITASEIDSITFVPVAGGLFDETVFGPIPRKPSGVADVWAMLTQRYLRNPTPEQLADGFVSKRAPAGWYGRWGRIRLATPVNHPWVVASGEVQPQIGSIPVLPPGLRPCVPWKGMVADSDLNCAYRRVLETTNPAQLQVAINHLFCNESLPEPVFLKGEPQRSLTGLVSPSQRWAALQDLDHWVTQNPSALSDPLPEPHFTVLAILRAVCLEVVFTREQVCMC